MPGNPARLALGPLASSEQVQKIAQRWGLNEPLPIQYFNWLRDFIHGDFGKSLMSGSPVSKDIISLFPATLELLLVVLFFMVLFGITIGTITAKYKGSAADEIIRVFTLAGVSSPRFFTAILGIVIFGGLFGILPLNGRIGVEPPPGITGLYFIDSIITGSWKALGDSLLHLILPAGTLALASIAQTARVLRADMIKVVNRDYTLAMKANGIYEPILRWKYSLRVAISAALTIIGLNFGFLLGNTFVVEMIFGWPGLGLYAYQSFIRTDVNAITGVIVTTGTIFILVNAVVDIIRVKLNPKIIGG